MADRGGDWLCDMVLGDGESVSLLERAMLWFLAGAFLGHLIFHTLDSHACGDVPDPDPIKIEVSQAV